MIAKQSREGWFQSRISAGYRLGTTPALRATPPDSGGETSLSLLNSFTPSVTAHDLEIRRFGFLQFRIALVKKKPFPSYLLLILDGMCAVFFVLADVFNEI